MKVEEFLMLYESRSESHVLCAYFIQSLFDIVQMRANWPNCKQLDMAS